MLHLVQIFNLHSLIINLAIIARLLSAANPFLDLHGVHRRGQAVPRSRQRRPEGQRARNPRDQNLLRRVPQTPHRQLYA